MHTLGKPRVDVYAAIECSVNAACMHSNAECMQMHLNADFRNWTASPRCGIMQLECKRMRMNTTKECEGKKNAHIMQRNAKEDKGMQRKKECASNAYGCNTYVYCMMLNELQHEQLC